MVFAVALSNLTGLNTTPVSVDVNAKDKLAPQAFIAAHHKTYSSDADHISSNESISTHKGTWKTFSVELMSTGYGHGTISGSVILTLVVLGLYCLTTLVHLIILISTRKVSTVWVSPIDFALVALRSHNPKFLSHTSAGAENFSTYRQPVDIRVKDEENLELVLADDHYVNLSTFRESRQTKHTESWMYRHICKPNTFILIFDSLLRLRHTVAKRITVVEDDETCG
ncbi:hypothetical protein IQ06DRAFT_338691 [Phaeosphaeriaceae sp. SRC1lsM3a]|nr:hypothetical protein IQ06DRAFT_338691 [Stagonospora sp. SRC1lsM3a]